MVWYLSDPSEWKETSQKERETHTDSPSRCIWTWHKTSWTWSSSRRLFLTDSACRRKGSKMFLLLYPARLSAPSSSLLSLISSLWVCSLFSLPRLGAVAQSVCVRCGVCVVCVFRAWTADRRAPHMGFSCGRCQRRRSGWTLKTEAVTSLPPSSNSSVHPTHSLPLSLSLSPFSEHFLFSPFFHSMSPPSAFRSCLLDLTSFNPLLYLFQSLVPLPSVSHTVCFIISADRRPWRCSDPRAHCVYEPNKLWRLNKCASKMLCQIYLCWVQTGLSSSLHDCFN